MSLGDVARKLQAMQADQGRTTTTGQRSFKDAHHGILAGRDKCLTQCSGWLTYRPGQGSGPPAGSRPGPLTGTVVTSCYPAAGPMHYGHPDAGRAQDMGLMYQEAPAAPSSGPSSSLPTLPRASTGALSQSGPYPSSPWDYKPNYKDGGPSRPRPSFASDKTFKHKRPTSPSNEKYEQHPTQKRWKGA